MEKDIILNNYNLHVTECKKKEINGYIEVELEFDVTSEEYHNIATLLYEGVFTVEIPSESLTFTGKLVQYSTSITNLYERGNVGKYKVKLKEVKD